MSSTNAVNTDLAFCRRLPPSAAIRETIATREDGPGDEGLARSPNRDDTGMSSECLLGARRARTRSDH